MHQAEDANAPSSDTPRPRLYTRALLGLTAHPVTVECHIGNGLPSTTIVGLPEGAVRESRDRVKSALTNSGFAYPDGSVVINLAPGAIAKSSAALDLPIAMSVLAATAQVRADQLANYEFLGELGLFGELRAVQGTLACALAAHASGRRLIMPTTNQTEAAVAPAGAIGLGRNLLEVANIFNANLAPLAPPHLDDEVVSEHEGKHLFDQVVGQQAAKRALTIAAAGGHHALMVGPPGTGKTMLARGFTSLLPRLPADQRLEVAALYSAAGMERQDYRAAPFRDPHHSASATALIGGGNPPMPGEVALAHHGVLFLDELPHFKPSALNLLREPIETGQAVITRAKYKVSFPCRFQLIAAMNPCPAGRSCSEGSCRCTASQVQRYQSRISGPMLDRIDIQVQVPELSKSVLANLAAQPETTAAEELAANIVAARQRQLDRQGTVNAALDAARLHQEMSQADLDSQFLQRAIEKYRLSARSYHKLWRLARTIADMEASEHICLSHMTEAMSYRALDWEAGVA